ncbi:TonB-dependent receptor [Jiulongibacter sp. NS-SX5]|uniref:TonB-dependent receptor n=1 Tax=Jiulongibacter sp. NS-SX5 TaxID=3463854 RepID=UPI004057D841
MKLKFSSILVLSVLPFIALAQRTSTVRGTVKESVSQSPIEKINVQVVNSNLTAVTDAEGQFIITDVPVGRLELKITGVGYTDQLIKELLLASNKELVIDVNLQTAISDLDEVMVTAASPNLSGAKTSIQTITVEQVMRFPATFFDPARLAFSFPGVANTNDQANNMSIRGNNPRGLQWRLEGLEIVNPNHLANAGTFSDQATVNGGGTNMLSAQMLGNMNFLTGAFPAEYGNALSGVMDMRLRKGNNKEFEHTAQVGLIGVDLASEGPLNRKKGSSYLINYRYSFTGLLALGGMTFGGEDIRFQDLAVNLSFPNKKLGDFTVFGMGGKNSNEFAFDDEEGLGPQQEKDLYAINYYSKMGAAGVTHEKTLNPSLLWKNNLVYSGLRNERNQTADPIYGDVLPSQFDLTKTSKFSFSTIFNRRFATSRLKSGAYVTRTADSLNIFNGLSAGEFDSWLIQPFIQYSGQINSSLSYDLGFHQMNYLLTKTSTFEPRAALSLALGSSASVTASYGRHSQLLDNWLYASNSDLKPTLSDHYVLNFSQRLGEKSNITVEAYYLSITNDLASQTDQFLTGMNLTGYVDPTNLVNGAKGNNYGLELNYSRYLDNGFFMLANATLYKSTSINAEGVEFASRYDGNYIGNLTLGKEWSLSKDRVFGSNIRLVYLGGFNNYEIDESASAAQSRTVFDYTAPLTDELPDYFRTDLRIYLKRSKNKLNRMWSIDIQNLTNQENVAFSYYDAFQNQLLTKYQLGMIPMLNYRWEF